MDYGGGDSREVRSGTPKDWCETPAPGEWLEIYKTNPAAKRIEQSSEVLQKLEALKKREEAKSKPQPWIKTQRADIIFGCLIVAYGLLTGVDVEITVRMWPDKASKGLETAMLLAQGVFGLAFLLELVLHVRAEGIGYCLPFVLAAQRPASGGGGCPLRLERGNVAGFLDAAIIITGVAEVGFSLVGLEGRALAAAGPMRMLRLVRLVRLLRGLLVFKQLRLLCGGMLSSLSAVFWAFVLLAMLMYLGSLFCVILLGKNREVEQYFGSVGQALFTHFMLVTLEAWPDISDATMLASSPFWAIYFIAFICISGLALVNLVTGVVCEKLVGISNCEEEEGQPNQLEAYQEDRARFEEKLTAICEECDTDQNGTITLDEFTCMLERPDMKGLLKDMDVSIDLDYEDFFRVLDSRNRDGVLKFEQIAEALLRLRGSRRKLHSSMLQRDILQRHRKEAERLAELEETLRKRTQAEFGAAEAAIIAKLESLHDFLVVPSLATTVAEAGDSPLGKGEADEPFPLLEEAVPVPAPFPRAAEPAQEVKWWNGCAGQSLPAGSAEEAALLPTSAPPAELAPPPKALQGPPPRWATEARDRLEALIGELDGLQASAQELLRLPDPQPLATEPPHPGSEQPPATPGAAMPGGAAGQAGLPTETGVEHSGHPAQDS